MRTEGAGGHPWVPSAVAQAPHGGGGGTHGDVAGVALERGRAAGGEVLCWFQLSVCDVWDGTLNLCGSPNKKGFLGLFLLNTVTVTNCQ